MTDAANGISGFVSVNSDLIVVPSLGGVTLENCTNRKGPSFETTYGSALTCSGLFSSKTWKTTQPARGAGAWVCEGSGTYAGKSVNFIYPSTDGKTCDLTSTLGAGGGNDKVAPGTYGSASVSLWYVTHWYGIFKVSGSFTWTSSLPTQATFRGSWVSTDVGAPTVSGSITGTVNKVGTGTFTYEDANGDPHTGTFKKL